ESYGGQWILNGSHRLAEGRILDGELLMTGGELTMEPDSLVTGSVHVLGGSLQVNNMIAGDLTQLSGSVTLGPQAVVKGDVNAGGGKLTIAPGATVLGEVDRETSVQIPAPPETPTIAGLRLLGLALPLVALALLAFVVVRFLPGPSSRVSRAGLQHPVVSTALGLLVLIVIPTLLVQMSFTIVLIPVSLLGGMLLGLTTIYGWLALGLGLGRLLKDRLKLSWQPALAALLGTLVLTVVHMVLAALPYAGTALAVLAVAISNGAVFLTRFGSRDWTPAEWTEAPPGS
ncbi:MAG: polymer-forming cytoskeletal protein, partial [Anaerolineae bacterium]